jgi:hypothetical protein
MRDIETHIMFGDLDSSVYPLRVGAFEDEAAPASRYLIAGFNAKGHPACGQPYARAELLFQHGDPSLVGRNGVTEEALLAVLLDRIQRRGKLRSAVKATWRAEHAIIAALTALREEPEARRV